MGELLLILLFILFAILIFIFLAFSIFWGAIIFSVLAVFSFFTSLFDRGNEYIVLEQYPSRTIMCVDNSTSNLESYNSNEYVLKKDKTSGEIYVFSKDNGYYKLDNCFYPNEKNYF